MTAVRERAYAATLSWEGNQGSGTADYGSYARRFRVGCDGKSDLIGSADPAFCGDAHLYNPEELLLAAVAACHMLTYLSLCARNGINVVGYTDDARGRLIENSAGGGRFEEVLLQPCVAVAPGSDEAAAIALHQRAHELCFIARSTSFPITCRPKIQAGGSNP